MIEVRLLARAGEAVLDRILRKGTAAAETVMACWWENRCTGCPMRCCDYYCCQYPSGKVICEGGYSCKSYPFC